MAENTKNAENEENGGGNEEIDLASCTSCNDLVKADDDFEDRVHRIAFYKEPQTLVNNKSHSESERHNLDQCCCDCHQTEHENVEHLAQDVTKVSDIKDDAPSIDTVSSVASPPLNNFCRICLDGGDLIAPCKCSGSTKYAHEHCLLQWFFTSSKRSCEVCLGNVNVTPIGYKPVQQWRLPDQGCDFIIYLFGLYFLIMVTFTGMITWIATQGCASPVCITLYVVCGIALLYFFYCCGCVEYSRRYWKTLLSINKIWRIYGREDSLKNFRYEITPKPTKRHVVSGTKTAKIPDSVTSVNHFVIEINENERIDDKGIYNRAVDCEDET